MRCHCGSDDAEGCAELGYCTGSRASAHDRDLAEADRAGQRALVPDHRSVAQVIADAARSHAECVAAEAAATAEHVEAVARDAARWTRWCAGCGVDVWPTYPRERACVRCGAPWPVREERAA